MKEIKFSRNGYFKLLPIDMLDDLILLEVFPIPSKEKLSKQFIEYDTAFNDEMKMDLFGFNQFYPLPSGELLVLLFMDSSGSIFTTVRSRYGKLGDKLPYYLDSRGHSFIIKIGE
jgi:hypothetical protein